MTIERIVFYGLSAWIGRIDSETRCRFWTSHPAEVNFDPVLMVPIDLSKTPSAARKGKIDWDEIQVDDFKDESADSGETTIGPWFPDGKTTGLVFLESSYYGRLRPELRPDLRPAPQACGELVTIVLYGDGRADKRAGRKYFGFQAKILSERKNSALVAVHRSGPAIGLDPPVEYAFDFTSADVDAHVNEGGMTQIGLGSGMAKEGILFIEASKAKMLGLERTKRPPACGIDFPPRRGPLRRRDLADQDQDAREIQLRRPGDQTG